MPDMKDAFHYIANENYGNKRDKDKEYKYKEKKIQHYDLFKELITLLMSDSTIYHKIITAKLSQPKKNKGIQPIKKMKRTLFSFQERLANLRENIGISDTSKAEEMMIMAIIIPPLIFDNALMYLIPMARDIQNNVLAGVGKPMKEWVWRVSKLNLARRKAEKTAIKNAR
jgi:hypothetical protein